MLLMIGSTVMYLLTGNGLAAFLTAGFLGVSGLLIYLQYCIDRRYIRGVVEDLTMLCNNLVSLEEKEVFPDNEDTQLSKLQSHIIKLVRILKKQKEDSRQEQENMKGLVSDISHQLKTPLANLKMYTEFLEDESLTEGQRREYTEVIRLSVERLNFLSESMIKVSRLESGLIQLNPEVQSINETVLTALKDIFPKARQKGVEITYTEGEEIVAYHDRRWSAEAVFNLLDNAVKYSPKGSVIAVKVRKLGIFMAIDVEDMAPVILEEEKTKIFQRFYRGQSSSHTEGIGIGLYLAREIVVKQGGYMNLTQMESGNVFTIYLPVGD